MIWRDLLFLKFKRDAKSLISAFVHSRTCITIAVLPTLLGVFLSLFPPLLFFNFFLFTFLSNTTFAMSWNCLVELYEHPDFSAIFSLTFGSEQAELVCLPILFAASTAPSSLHWQPGITLLWAGVGVEGRKIEWALSSSVPSWHCFCQHGFVSASFLPRSW